MELNLKYYNGKDKYTDGKIEDKIIKYIKNNSNYEDVILKDNSWPVFYHLSDMRKNVVSWYPFKKDASILEIGAGMGALTDTLCDKCKSVTSVELSKKRATAILERNKDKKNLEIIVGNFNDIKFNKKFDYILLCESPEYNISIQLIESLKQLLNPNGRLLIALDNRLGLKCFCGAYNNIDDPFDGINGYSSKHGIKTSSKAELDSIIKATNMNANYYYMFPDYRFPQLIITEEGINKVNNLSYIPYYYKQMELVINETKLFDDIKANGLISTFANSYFLELSEGKSKKEIEYVKFNFYRKEKYKLNTCLINDKFYKVANSEESNYQLDNLIRIEELLDESNIKHLKSNKDSKGIYTDYSNLPTLEKTLDDYLKNNEISKIYDVYNRLFNYYKSILGKATKSDNTIFDKYNIKITKQVKDKLHFYKNGFIDIIPGNILVDKDKYILFDQEWYEENVPVEYLMYRAIVNFFCNYSNEEKLMTKMLKEFSVNYSVFNKLDEEFLRGIFNNNYYMILSCNNNGNIINLKEQKLYIKDLEKNNISLNNRLNESLNKQVKLENDYLALKGAKDIIEMECAAVKERLNEIEGSKGFRLLNKFYKLRYRFRKKGRADN